MCKQVIDGEEVLGLRLNFEKRWITLSPIATVVGLAFRLFDPDHLLGEEEDRGITLALVPRNTAGMEIGRRHHPIGSPFLNGPIKGKDVFVPLDTIIGGTEMIGQGWRMLVECLSIGRCITLPSGASGTMRYALGWTGGFGRIRRQFNVPVVEMEGVQEPLARLASLGYIAQAAVYQTANTIDRGEKPAVPSAILKSQLTEFQRLGLSDAMDIHGGKAVTLGPRNYLGIGYSANPVSITVEGANIMTRNLMIFGQGAIRCHPFVLKELAASDSNDLKAFDHAFFGHAALVFGNAARAFTMGLGIGKPSVPFDAIAAPYASDMARLSAAFSLCADAAMASLGSALKQREMISARLGDVLSNLYLASMVLKHWQEGDKVEGEAALLHYSCTHLLQRAEQAFDELFDNLPNRALGGVLRAVTMPTGRRWKRPADALTRGLPRRYRATLRCGPSCCAKPGRTTTAPRTIRWPTTTPCWPSMTAPRRSTARSTRPMPRATCRVRRCTPRYAWRRPARRAWSARRTPSSCAASKPRCSSCSAWTTSSTTSSPPTRPTSCATTPRRLGQPLPNPGPAAGVFRFLSYKGQTSRIIGSATTITISDSGRPIFQ